MMMLMLMVEGKGILAVALEYYGINSIFSDMLLIVLCKVQAGRDQTASFGAKICPP